MCITFTVIAFTIFCSISNTATLNLTINNDITGTIGTNGTQIECTYDNIGVSRFTDLRIQSLINNVFTDMVYFDPDGYTSLMPAGNELSGRVSFNNITQSSRRIFLHFDILMCSDQRDYRCQVSYKSGFDSKTNTSNSTNIQVQDPPQKPRSIALLRVNGSQDQQDNTTAGTKPMTNHNASTSEPSSKTDDSNNCFINITNQFIKCSYVLVTCVGVVGEPPENLTAQMIVNDTIITNLTTYLDPSNNVIKEKCSMIRTASFATNLTRTRNRIKFRCAPTSFIHEEGVYLETKEVEFFYAVQKPSIVVTPEILTYPPVTLYCTADGNPSPQYHWFKNGDTTLISGQQTITIDKANESGIYKCVVNNTFGQQEKEANITLKEVTTTTTRTTDAKTTIPTSTPEYPTTTTMKTDVKTTTPTSSSANPNTTPSADERKTDKKKLTPIILGVAGGVVFIIIVAVIIIKCRHSSKPGNIQRRDDDLKMSSRRGVDNYYSMTLDEDNGKQRDSAEVQNQQEETRKHNERYLKQQELESNKREGDPQPVEYAAVNKPKKGRPYQNTDVHQPAEYAQVSKMRGNSSNEPAPDYDDDPYASGKGIYDHAHDRRHKKTEDLESYDTAASVMNRKSGKNKINLGSVPDTTAEAIKQRQERQSQAINQVDDNLKENVKLKTSL